MLLDQTDTILAQDHPVQHEKLHHYVRCLVCNTYIRGLYQYINFQQKIRRKMIKCRVPNVIDGNDRETVRFILMGLVDYPTYAISATNMFSTYLPITITGVKERL